VYDQVRHTLNERAAWQTVPRMFRVFVMVVMGLLLLVFFLFQFLVYLCLWARVQAKRRWRKCQKYADTRPTVARQSAKSGAKRGY
jgi:hypothetical protein